MTGKLFAVIILLVVLGTGALLLSKFPPLKLPGLPKLTDWFLSDTNYPKPTLIPLYSATPSASVTPTPSPTPKFSPLIKPTSTPRATPKPTTAAKPTPQKDCYHYLITHLDGSTSNLCYSSADYNTLVNLGFKLSSAKSFYEFHIDGVADYEAEYKRSGSSIYLDAKASQQRQADSEKVKIDQVTLEMYNVEARGY